MSIPFIRYNDAGEPSTTSISRPSHVEDRAALLIDAGVRFEIVVPIHGSIILRAVFGDEDDPEELASTSTPVATGVPEAVDYLVQVADFEFNRVRGDKPS